MGSHLLYRQNQKDLLMGELWRLDIYMFVYVRSRVSMCILVCLSMCAT